MDDFDGNVYGSAEAMSARRLLITGGCGFIGTNLAEYFAHRGWNVTVLDNLSRKGAVENLLWLQQHLRETRFVHADIRTDHQTLRNEVGGADAVFHLASQVAVTTSFKNPAEDCEINAIGTLNLLEAIRSQQVNPVMVYASTNKVYGGMEDVAVELQGSRYRYRDLPKGIPEDRFLDFHSPYGCCFSADTDVLTEEGWKRFNALAPKDRVLTYNLERKVAEYQKPSRHFAYRHTGKMYVQNNRRLKTCVTPNHKMLVSWDCNHDALERPRLLEAEQIAGKPMAYLLAADYQGGEESQGFTLPGVKAGKRKHRFPPRRIPMDDWLRFLGWYLAEGHCYENKKTGNCTVTLTTYYRTAEAVAVMKAIGLSPVIDGHHITATSRQLYEYVKQFGKSRSKYIPREIMRLHRRKLAMLLKALLEGDGNQQSKNSWRYTTNSRQLADDVQEIAIKCGMAASLTRDRERFYRVYLGTTRTAQCNLEGNKSAWVNYQGMVYCVEVPNSTVMVRQNGHAYFSGNSKGAGDQYTRDYARVYGLNTVVMRQSCIYGPRQYGITDQGWIAWFMVAASGGTPITIYGDGKQVRDVLHVADLARAYELAVEQIGRVRGQIFNIGGGADRTLSLLELIEYLEQRLGHPLARSFSDWRPGDQPCYVSDITKARAVLGWEPNISTKEGLDQLFEWVQEHHDDFRRLEIVKSPVQEKAPAAAA